MGVYKRNGKWWIDHRDHGKRIRKAIGSKEGAEALLTVLKEDLVETLIEIVNEMDQESGEGKGIRFDKAVQTYMEWARGNKGSWARDELSLSHLLDEFKGKKLSDIEKLDIERYKLKRKDEVAPRTVNEELNCLRRFYYRAIEWGLAKDNPVKGVKRFREPPGRVKVLSVEEESRLLEACTPHIRPVVLTALCTGMRRGEILRLQWQDVDFNRNVIVVRDSKNGESREIPMTDTLRRTLSGLPKVSEFVFTSHKGEPFKCIRNMFEKAVKKAGLVDFRFHDCRHVFASNLRIMGAEITDIKDCLGHKTLAMTMRYAHITSKRKQEVIRLLDGHQMGTDEKTLTSVRK